MTRLPAVLAIAALLAAGIASSARAGDEPPSTLEGWLRRQDGMLLRKEKDLALAEARERAEKEPRSPEAHYLYGRILDITGMDDDARAQFQVALDLDPEFAPAWTGMSMHHLRKNELDAALRAAERAHALRPSHETREIQVLVLTAKKDRPGAYRLLREALQEDPDDWRTRLLYAKLLLRDDLIGDAEKELRMVLTANGALFEAREALVRLHWRRGDEASRDRAIEECRSGMRDAPRDPRIRFLLVDLLIEREQYRLAADVMDGVLGLDIPAETRERVQREIRRLNLASSRPRVAKAPTPEELKKRIDSESVEERREALRLVVAAGGVPPDEAFARVRDEDEIVRRLATRLWLQRADGERIFRLDEFLFHAKERETSAATRAEIVEALGRVQSPAALPTLVLALDDADAATVQAAVVAISRITGKSFTADLHRAPTEEELPAIRRRYATWWREEPSGRFFRRKAAEEIAKFDQRSLGHYVVEWIVEEDAALRAAVLDCVARLTGRDEWRDEDSSSPEARAALLARLREDVGGRR